MSIQDPLEPIDESQASEPSEADFSAEQEAVIEKPRRPVNSSAMLLFGLLAAVGGSTYLMCLRAGSQSVQNDPSVAAAATTINAFLKGGAQDQRQMAVMLRDTEKVVNQFGSYPSAHQVPLSDLRSNPFQDAADTQPSISVSDATARQLQEAQEKAAQAVAQQLKLQSIFSGAHAICMINGKAYSQGQGTDTFIVEQILPHGVWVRVGSLRIELTMAPPRLN
jgi:hypothetical protein